MQERIKEAGGRWQIQSQPGEGTTITASFPIITPMTIDITQREKEVLRLIVEGLSNREIAQRLAISTDTVKTHIHHIMQKLQVKDRIQAAIVASTHRWL
jgi:DNA-binding NarL/FixJ family response regulator